MTSDDIPPFCLKHGNPMKWVWLRRFPLKRIAACPTCIRERVHERLSLAEIDYAIKRGCAEAGLEWSKP